MSIRNGLRRTEDLQSAREARSLCPLAVEMPSAVELPEDLLCRV